MCGSATRTIRLSRLANSPRTTPCWSTAWSASRSGSAAMWRRPRRREKSWGCSGRSDVEQRTLGKSGLKVSAVGLGCNNFGRRVHDTAVVQGVVHRALDLGVTLFDTADAYGSG